MPDLLQSLNQTYGRANAVRFACGPGNLPVAVLTTPQATASVALHGAHVLSYQPAGQPDVLWLSTASLFKDGEPIRGGVPVCWPWFGAHPTDPALPAHGFARRRAWQVVETVVGTDGSVRLALELSDDADSRAVWPQAFCLRLDVTVGATLTLALTMTNRGTAPFTCTSALHTYFAVGDVSRVQVHGLDGVRYIDTVNGANTEHVQQGPVTVTAEVDRLYLDTASTCTIDMPALARRVAVEKSGSRSTVVWNPWIAKSQRMPDFGDREYPEMICVETTNARADSVTLAPNETHVTVAVLRPLPL